MYFDYRSAHPLACQMALMNLLLGFTASGHGCGLARRGIITG
jgi:hypothetical protein